MENQVVGPISVVYKIYTNPYPVFGLYVCMQMLKNAVPITVVY